MKDPSKTLKTNIAKNITHEKKIVCLIYSRE